MPIRIRDVQPRARRLKRPINPQTKRAIPISLGRTSRPIGNASHDTGTPHRLHSR